MWIRVDDAFSLHPKFCRAGVAAKGWWLDALAYCNRGLTDGFIAARDLHFVSPFTPPTETLELVEILVRERLLERCDGGFMMHDYLEYQLSREEVLSLREDRREAGRRGGRNTAKARRDLAKQAAQARATASAQANAQGLAAPSPLLSSPQPLLSENGSSHTPEEPTKVRPRGEDAPTKKALTADRLVDLYNELTPKETSAVVTRSPERMRKARQYLSRFPHEQFWRDTFAQFHRSDFLRGLKRPANGHDSFTADFDWLLSKGKDGTENVVKVHDGRYRNGT